MGEVKRLRGAELSFIGDPFATYVLASDYDALAAECERLKEREKWREKHVANQRHEISTLRKKLAALAQDGKIS